MLRKRTHKCGNLGLIHEEKVHKCGYLGENLGLVYEERTHTCGNLGLFVRRGYENVGIWGLF